MYSYKVGQFQRRHLIANSQKSSGHDMQMVNELEVLGSAPSEQGSLTRTSGVTVTTQVLENQLACTPFARGDLAANSETV